MEKHFHMFLDALKHKSFYPHPVSKVELIETHISWVFLTGEYVYKIKKPVDMGFLDFSTLEKRRFYCEEELRLNKRLAPDYYLDVIRITGDLTRPVYNGEGEAFEYAVKMRQFPQSSQLDRVLARNELSNRHMELLAAKIASFHQTTPKASDSMEFGDLRHVNQAVLDCYQNIYNRVTSETDIKRVKQIESWSTRTFSALKSVFIARKKQGFIRECHGDLHLRNIAIDKDEVIAFDCIEFNENLRWNDVMSEVGFLIMDLDDHKRTDLAYVFLNAYLEKTGDYVGLEILAYYLVYRAIVRAMVNAIRLDQADLSQTEHDEALKDFREYVNLAESYMQAKNPYMILTCGFSGSGKTYLAKSLGSLLPAIHIRSDVERKRLHSVELLQRSKDGLQQGLYSTSASVETYAHLNELAKQIVRAGFNVIVDATFLKQSQRHQFADMADNLEIPFLILRFDASKEVLVDRIEKRLAEDKDASDANLAVLHLQMQNYQPISGHELSYSLTIDTSLPVSMTKIVQQIKSLLENQYIVQFS